MQPNLPSLSDVRLSQTVGVLQAKLKISASLEIEYSASYFFTKSKKKKSSLLDIQLTSVRDCVSSIII
jgi:hypothetical protein